MDWENLEGKRGYRTIHQSKDLSLHLNKSNDKSLHIHNLRAGTTSLTDIDVIFAAPVRVGGMCDGHDWCVWYRGIGVIFECPKF